ncbi:MAG: cysteine peptidase family C39 domain-containing protein [Caldilineaceae bacterium]
MPFSAIAHWRQPRDGDCLPACVAMVLTHLGETVDYPKLRHRLETTEIGTPFSHVDRLRSWRLQVERGHGDLSTLQHQLASGHPVIVAVATEFLPDWLTRPDLDDSARLVEHAVVVVGLTEDSVAVYDPDLAKAPQLVELDWFLAAWQGQYYRYAVIRRRGWRW